MLKLCSWDTAGETADKDKEHKISDDEIVNIRKVTRILKMIVYDCVAGTSGLLTSSRSQPKSISIWNTVWTCSSDNTSGSRKTLRYEGSLHIDLNVNGPTKICLFQEANRPEQRAERPWIITMAHRPMYCSDDDGDDCTRFESYVCIWISSGCKMKS